MYKRKSAAEGQDVCVRVVPSPFKRRPRRWCERVCECARGRLQFYCGGDSAGAGTGQHRRGAREQQQGMQQQGQQGVGQRFGVTVARPFDGHQTLPLTGHPLSTTAVGMGGAVIKRTDRAITGRALYPEHISCNTG